MSIVSEREHNLWDILAGIFENTPVKDVAASLSAKGFIQTNDIKHTYISVVAPGMPLLCLTEKERHGAFSRKEMFAACFKFHRSRRIPFFVGQFGRYMCYKAGGVMPRWKELEKELFRQLCTGKHLPEMEP